MDWCDKMWGLQKSTSCVQFTENSNFHIMNEEENQEKDNIIKQESIDDILKRVQILKIESELSETKKNYFKKFIYPELPKWVPALFLGFITLWITTSKDIIGVKEDKLVVKQDKVAIDEKTLELKKIEENIKKLNDVQVSKKDSVRSLDMEFLNKLAEIKDLNNKITSYQKLYDNERAKAEDLGRIQVELTTKNSQLTKESYIIKSNSLLDKVYNSPDINNKNVYEIIEVIKSKSELSEGIIKEIEANIAKSFHKPINYYILYISTKNEKYLTSMIDGIRLMCSSSQGVFDNNTMSELLNVLESRNFSKKEHELVSRTILTNISSNPDIKNKLIQFVTLPGYYFGAIYNFDNSFLDDSFWIPYIALHNKLLQRKNEYEQSQYQNADFRNNQYKYNTIINDKRNLLYNLYRSFPQVAFANFIELFSKGSWNSLSGIQSENIVLGQYLLNLSTSEFSKCQSIFETAIDGNIFENTDENTDIKKLFEELNNMVCEIKKYKLKNNDKIKNWTDIEMKYYSTNKSEFNSKLRSCDL